MTGYNRTGHYDGLGVFGKRGDIDKYVKSVNIFFFKWHPHPCTLTVVNYEGYFDWCVCRVGVYCEGYIDCCSCRAGVSSKRYLD